MDDNGRYSNVLWCLYDAVWRIIIWAYPNSISIQGLVVSAGQKEPEGPGSECFQTCDKIAAIRVELFVSWVPWGERSGNPPPGCSIRPYPAPTIWVWLKIGPSKSGVKLYLLNSYCSFGRALRFTSGWRHRSPNTKWISPRNVRRNAWPRPIAQSQRYTAMSSKNIQELFHNMVQ